MSYGPKNSSRYSNSRRGRDSRSWRDRQIDAIFGDAPLPYYQKKERVWEKRIIAVDGEGWGEDENGVQNYMLMVAADEHGWSRTLYTGERLTSAKILEWLISLPPAHYTSFSFGYDAAMIFRDLPVEAIYEIAGGTKIDENGDYQLVKWSRWGFSYLKSKALTIRLFPSPSRSIVIYDAWPFHQKKFLDCLKDNKVAISDEDYQIIEEGKNRRGTQDAGTDWQEEAKYCMTEMRALARITHAVYKMHDEAGMPLTSYYGAGSSATALFKKHHVIIPEFVCDDSNYVYQRSLGEVPFEEAVDLSYFGGRFETIGHGYQRRVWQFDINSAYPFATSKIPCLCRPSVKHTGYGHSVNLPKRDTMGVYLIRWWSDGHCPWGPFAARDIHGRPFWPFSGIGWVWTPELLEGIRLPGVSYELLDSYVITSDCNHGPQFDWINDIFNLRRQYKKEGDGREKPLKLGPNAFYGKFAQRIGRAKYHCAVYAAWITASCRGQLLHAIADNPERVFMVATDAVYSTSNLNLDTGDHLGGWEPSDPVENIWVVAPGIYFEPGHKDKYGEPAPGVKCRGIPNKYLTDEVVNGAISTWLEHYTEAHNQVQYMIPVQHFHGLGSVRISGSKKRLGVWVGPDTPRPHFRKMRWFSEKRPYVVTSSCKDGWRDTVPPPMVSKVPLSIGKQWKLEVLGENVDWLFETTEA